MLLIGAGDLMLAASEPTVILISIFYLMVKHFLHFLTAAIREHAGV